MENQTSFRPKSIFPDRMLVLSGSGLKLIAILFMLIDHIAADVLKGVGFANQVLFTVSWPFGIFEEKSYSLYRIMRDAGRIAMPIFVFLLVEGFLHTRSRLKYGRNLFLFALISELPWNFVHTGTLRYSYQNVFFTLFLGYLGMCAAEYFWENRLLQCMSLLLLLAVSVYLHADYGWKGYIFILIMYFLRNERSAQAIIGSCWLHYEWKACFAFLFINLYNGERGFIRGKSGKYFFYAFYPLHLLILGIIRFYVLGK